MDSQNPRRRVRRVEVFLTRIDGDYPALTFRVGESKVPFIRGRLWLEGDLADATEIAVSVPDDSAFVPAMPVVPVKGGRLMVQLVARQAPEVQSETPEELAAAAEAPSAGQWAGVPDAEYFDDDELEPKGKASKATIWILGIACMVCVAVLAWYFMYGRGRGEGAIADSDSVKADTVLTDSDSVKADTALTTVQEAGPLSAPSYGSYGGGYSSYSYDEADTAVEPEKRERKPAYDDYTTQGEH